MNPSYMVARTPNQGTGSYDISVYLPQGGTR